MKNIFSYLYYGELNEAHRSVKDLQKTEEYKSYAAALEKLTASFSEAQEDLFESYFECEGNYTGIEKERIYPNGVKTGMCLALSLLDFEP